MKETKRLSVHWPIAILLGLVCSLPALAHDYDDGYWRPHHHEHGYYGWQRPYYAPPPPPVYYPGPQRYMPPPPQIVYGAPPVWREPPPVMRPPQYYGWR